METGLIIFIVIAIIVIIYILFIFKGMRHKFFTLFLIGLVLFAFFSFSFVFEGKNIPLNNISDLGKASQIYFAWLGNAFNNVKIVTTQAIKMNWKGNSST